MAATPEEKSAVLNALGSIQIEMRLPKYVFLGGWYEYLFFDESLIFNAQFLEVVANIIDYNGDSAIALVHLREIESKSASDTESPPFFFDRQTQMGQYREWIRNDGAGYQMLDRVVCASEKGTWCIYCEPIADIAILAVSSDFSNTARAKVSELLAAASVDSVTAREGRSSVDFVRFAPMFRSELVAHYSRHGLAFDANTIQDDVTQWLDRKEIVGVARMMLSGDFDLIEGVRRLKRLMQPEFTRVFDRYSALWALDEKASSYPIGDSRKLWATEFLQRQDRLIAAYLLTQRPKVLECCDKLVKEFSDS